MQGIAPLSRPSSAARGPALLAAAVLAAAALAAYANTFSVPFLFDDGPSIPDNPTIRHLWTALVPPHGQGLTVEGRPVLNLSLAVNYALSGTAVWSYHAANLLIHVLAGLTLFGIIRRSLGPAAGPGATPDDRRPLFLALAVALLWVVHPLQTESVTYVVQRAESLMSLFYLLTLYFFIRGAAIAGTRSRLWLGASWLACLLGMGTKEVMVSAPLVVLLYDRALVAGTFREAWGRRGRYYAALGATWLLLGALVWRSGSRGGTVAGGSGVTPWRYALTQFQAVAHYLRLAVWPRPLIFDYGTAWVRGPGDVLPYVPVVVLLVAGTAWALWRRPALGLLGFAFLAILSPTSSVIPGNRQTLAEHRMYLPLATVLIVLGLGLERLAAKLPAGRPARLVLGLCLAAALPAVALTARRNQDYRSALALYADTVAKRPDNGFARYNLGKTLDESGQPEAAIPQYLAAIRLRPGSVNSYYNLGNALTQVGRMSEAADAYRAAIQLKPDDAEARYNLGNVLVALGRKEEAMGEYRAALRARPDYAEARDNLGATLLELGRYPEAEREFREVLATHPGMAETHVNLGTTLLLLGRPAEAAEQFERALAIDPGFAAARQRLGQARRMLGR